MKIRSMIKRDAYINNKGVEYPDQKNNINQPEHTSLAAVQHQSQSALGFIICEDLANVVFDLFADVSEGHDCEDKVGNDD